jgi:transcriptional regulator with XRE-family HTH domain
MYPNLKLQMWKVGMRQNRLAKMLEMDETILSKIVNGFREPNEQTRAKIAAALESDEAWLFESAQAVQAGAVNSSSIR